MSIKTQLLILLICNNILGCIPKTSKEDTIILQNYADESTKYCVMIPNEGCAGCISDATAYFKDNIDKYPELIIIFTNVVDKKELKVKVGNSFLSRNNVYIDTSSIQPSLENHDSIYPHIFYLDKGMVIKHNVFTVDNFLNDIK